MPIDVKAHVDVNKTRKGRDFKDEENSLCRNFLHMN